MAKRRANGEGTITKRADGRYQAAAYVYRPDGTRVRKFVYGRTRDEVSGKLIEMQDKTRQGIPAATSAMAFGDYLTYWLAAIAPIRLKPATLNSYEGLSRLYIKRALGKKRLNRLSPTDVRLFLASFKDGCLCCLRGVDAARPEEEQTCCAVRKCCERRPSARTVQYVHAVLRSALQQAVREELIARNVAKIVETPTVKREEVRPLDAGEARLLLKTARPHRLYALWLLLVSTGLRRGFSDSPGRTSTWPPGSSASGGTFSGSSGNSSSAPRRRPGPSVRSRSPRGAWTLSPPTGSPRRRSGRWPARSGSRLLTSRPASSSRRRPAGPQTLGA